MKPTESQERRKRYDQNRFFRYGRHAARLRRRHAVCLHHARLARLARQRRQNRRSHRPAPYATPRFPGVEWDASIHFNGSLAFVHDTIVHATTISPADIEKLRHWSQKKRQAGFIRRQTGNARPLFSIRSWKSTWRSPASIAKSSSRNVIWKRFSTSRFTKHDRHAGYGKRNSSRRTRKR